MKADLISRIEAAALLDIDESQITKYILSGDLPPQGESFDRAEVLAFRRRREADQKAAIDEMLALSEKNGWGSK